jgi:hypothetical protein
MRNPKATTQSIRGDARLTTQFSVADFDEVDNAPDWSRTCEVCGARPVVPSTGMCGPCTFGEADTAEGNW